MYSMREANQSVPSREMETFDFSHGRAKLLK